MYSAAEIEAMRLRAKRLNMSAPDRYWRAPARELASICNGYGPDRWPDKLRKLVTWVFRNYPEPATIHDVRYEYSDGTEAGCAEADSEFLLNLKIAHHDLYGSWWYLSWAGVWGRRKIRLAYLAVRKHGAGAWQAAYQRRIWSKNNA